MVMRELCSTNADEASQKDYSSSVVKVECGQNYGTAICIHSSNTIGGHLFLTCAHVVQQRKQSVILHHDGRVINGKVIYTTPKGVPYDIAVIVSEPIVGIIPCQMSDGGAIIAGQKVFAVGYALRENILSTAVGYILKVSSSVLTTTCNVHIGFSGGPVFTSNGKLLGLTVGKLNIGTVNFVLPSTVFVETLNKFIQSNDVKILDDLQSKSLLNKLLWKNGIPDLNVIFNCHI